jgi:RNA polymerase sigma-70 factor, ECF subfamily
MFTLREPVRDGSDRGPSRIVFTDTDTDAGPAPAPSRCPAGCDAAGARPALRRGSDSVAARGVTRLADEELFSQHRSHLMGVAYRMLGSRTEAEDAVQETWLRYAAADPAGVADLRAWLTTVTARICLDQLRSARVRRESYVGQWLPEPTVERLPAGALRLGGADEPDPGEVVARTERVSLALLVVLEKLGPEQRLALVLHDVFAVPFHEIATILDTTPAAARQLASRARRAVADDGVRQHADLAEQRRVLRAFLAAAQHGDLAGLLAVLAPDVVAIGDGGGVAPAARQPIVGAAQVARFLLGLFRQIDRFAAVAEPVLVNGDLGLLIEAHYPDGRALRFVFAPAIADGRITAIFDQLNPAKLAGVPAPDPERDLLSST